MAGEARRLTWKLTPYVRSESGSSSPIPSHLLSLQANFLWCQILGV